MEKVRLIVLLLGISTLVVSACSPTAEPTAIAVIAPSTQVEQPIASSTPEQVEQLATLTESPTDIPPTPTLVPTPTIPWGTLTLTSQYGYGTGLSLEPTSMRLSADEERLIIPTTGGIFIFSAKDLSPILTINEPLYVGDDFRFSPNIDVSRDGTIAVTHSQLENYDRVLRVWDLNTGEKIKEFMVVPAELTSGKTVKQIKILKISPDNQQAVMVFNDGLIWVVNLIDGTVVKMIEKYKGKLIEPNFFEFDPEGKYAYYLYADGLIQRSSIRLDGKSFAEKSRVNNGVPRWGAFSPTRSNSGTNFGYFQSKKLDAIDYSTGEVRFHINRNDVTSSLSFSPNGETVVMGGSDPIEMEVWGVGTTAKPEITYSVPSMLWSVAASSDGNSFYGVTMDGLLYKWERDKAEPVAVRDGFWSFLDGLQFTNNGQTLQLFPVNNGFLGRSGYRLIEVNASTGDLENISPNPYFPGEMKDLIIHNPIPAISPDYSLGAFIPIDQRDTIQLFNPENGNFIRKIDTKFDLDNLDFTADGKAIVVSGSDKDQIQVIDISTGKVIREIPVSNDPYEGISDMRLSGDRSTLVLEIDNSDYTRTLKAYNLDTFEEIGNLDKTIPVRTFGVSENGKDVAMVSYDGKLMLWNILNDTLSPEFDLRVFYGNTSLNDILSYKLGPEFSPDGSKLALATNDGLIRLFDIAP